MFVILIFRYFKGYVVALIKSTFAERFLNLCTKKNITLWNVKKKEPRLMEISLYQKDFIKLRSVAKATHSKVKIKEKRGFPFFVHKYRKRYALFFGVAIFALLIFMMSSVLWSVSVTGCEVVKEEYIKQALLDAGLKPGVLLNKIKTDAISDEVLTKVPELSYVGINIKGTKATVEIKERVNKPKIVQRNIPSNIVAKKDGLILTVEAYDGIAKCQVGNSVQKGDLLVSGLVDSKILGLRTVHSSATVIARTWQNFKCDVPYQKTMTEKTGSIKKLTSVNISGFRINLYLKGRIPYQKYDKIVTSKPVKLFGFDIPMTITKTKYVELRDYIQKYTKDEAKQKAKELLLSQKDKEISPFVVTDEKFSFEETNNGINAVLQVECEEDIGLQVAILKENQ